MPCERITNDQGGTIDDTPCQACQKKTPFRAHVYLAVFDPKRHETFLFECTATAAKPLADYRQANSTLRGCVLHAQRPKCTQNAKVVIDTATANLVKTPIPNSPDVQAALAIIWRLPKTAIKTETQKHRHPRITTDRDELNELRSQPDNATDPPTIGEIIKGNGHNRTKVLK